MKKASFYEILTCVLFCAFIGIMGLMYLLLPKDGFSELEKRNLASSPEFSWENLTSGQFGSDLESYMADHMPGRDFFVGLGAYYDLLTGQQSSKDIYLAEGGRLVEKPTIWNAAQAEKNMKYINRFAEKMDVPVDLIIVPSAGFILEDKIQGIHDSYYDDKIIDRIYDLAGNNIRRLNLISLYQNSNQRENLYYRTDHHWTSYGAYKAYEAYMQCLKREYLPEVGFRVERFDGFRGSTYSRSKLWLTAGEEIQLWHGSNLTVQNSVNGLLHNGPFYYDRLQEVDMYTVYLDGNQPLVRIINKNNTGAGKLLVIRDSYANCIGPMLAESFEEVVLVDLRYYHQSLSQLAAAEGFDHILVLYSIGNFMTDSNFPYLQ